MVTTAQGLFKKTTLLTAAFVLVVSTLAAAVPFILSQKAAAVGVTEVVYDALPSVIPQTSYPSKGFQATSTSQLGDLVQLGASNRILDTVTVGLVNWAMYSEYASDPVYSGNAASWAQPVSLKVYANNAGAPGALLVNETQTFNIPWRPAGDPTCTEVRTGVYGWKVDGVCYNYNGFANNISFNLSSLNVTLPEDAIVAVGYNTQTYGANPTGVAGPYNSLNVAVPAGQAIAVGSSDASTTFWDSTYLGRPAGLSLATGQAPNGTVALKITASAPVIPADVYVDDNYTAVNTDGHVWGVDAFANIQEAIDAVAVGGTVHIADGDYYGTVSIVKEGIKLVGTTNSRDTVKIHPTALSGQAGVFVNGVDNVVIQNLGVYGDQFVVGGAGALIKLNDGSNARIENVAVKASSASGININSYSDVIVSGVYVEGAGRDGISVVAQQGTTTNSSHDITITNTSVSGAAWSAIAFYTSTGTSKSIENVTIANVRTQYGLRGLYVEGNTGKTVTSPSSTKLVLQNFYAGDNSNEYINNEQSADIDARGIEINVGNGVVVPASAMTQAQYDTAYTFIKDKLHKNPTSQPYGNVILTDVAAAVLSLATAGGDALSNNASTNVQDVVSSWTRPVGAVKFTYKSWTDNGSSWNEANPYTVNDITGTSRDGSFVLGEGNYYIQITAIDAYGNQSNSNVFKVTYDTSAPTISWQLQPTPFIKGAFHVRPITFEQPTSKAVYIDSVSEDNLCWALTSDHFNFDTSNDSCPTLLANFADGEHKFLAVFKDAAGNTTSSFSDTFILDRTGPSTPVAVAPTGLNQTATAFTWNESTDLAGPVTYEIITGASTHSLDNGKLTNGVNVITTNATGTSFAHTFGEGTFFWQIQATDSLGNKSEWSNIQAVTIDSVAPGLPERTFPAENALINTNDFYFDWNDTEGAVRYEIQASQSSDVDGNGSLTSSVWPGDFQQIQPTESRAHSVGANGTWYWQVRAIDAAGNKGAWTSPWSVTIDLDSPEAFLNATQEDSFTPTLRGTASPDATKVFLTINGNPEVEATVTTPGVWEYTVPAPLTAGEYDLSVVAQDAATNRSTTPATGILTITAPAPAPTNTENQPDTGEVNGATTSNDQQTPVPVANPIAVVVPSIVGPAAALGVTTDDSSAANSNNNEAVEGVSTLNSPAQAVDSEANQGTFLGLGWYWWLLILAAIAAIAWWIIAAVRKRQAE